MMSSFQIFKIILGIAISFVVLFFAIRFVGSYYDIGESSVQVSTAVNFKKAIEDTYTTGIPVDFSMEKAEIVYYVPPQIGIEKSSFNVEPIPIVLVAGKEFSLHRNEYDLGWWKFYFVEAFPETKILFMPLGETDDVWDAVVDITKFMPSTGNTETSVKFYVGCNETEEDRPYPLGERSKFTDYWLPRFIHHKPELVSCGGTGDYMAVTISDEDVDAGFLVQPRGDGTGTVRIKKGEEYEEYVYKNGLDVVTLLTGGDLLYNYMNGKFLNELRTAADISIRESELLMSSDTPLGERCGGEFSGFIATLTAIKDLADGMEFEDEAVARSLATLLRRSMDDYEKLESRGCS